MSTATAPATTRRRPRRALVVAVGLVALGLVAWSLAQSSAPAQCRDAAEARWASGGAWVTVTFDEKRDDGWFVKGAIESSAGVTRYWECVDGSITWSSSAG